MTRYGHVRNGQIVLNEPAELPDGTAVAVDVRETLSTGRGSADAILSALEPWQGPPGEVDRLLTEIQQLRDGDVLPLRNNLE